MAELTRDQLLEAMRELAGTEPTVVVEPAHITEWSVERTVLGKVVASPPELERVTVTYDNGRNTLTAVVYDRECDIVQAFEMSEFMKSR